MEKENTPYTTPAEDAPPASCERECCQCVRHKHREKAEYDSLLRRLNRIEGQIRGIRGMVEKDAYCTDILTQVSAAQAALNAFSGNCWAAILKPASCRIFKTGMRRSLTISCRPFKN